jgi:hypothetical protein
MAEYEEMTRGDDANKYNGHLRKGGGEKQRRLRKISCMKKCLLKPSSDL